MKTKLTADEKWWNDCADYEATHEIAFASPTALVDARIIAELEKKCSALRRARRKAPPQRRKAAAV